MWFQWLMGQVGNGYGLCGLLIWIARVVDLGTVVEVVDGSSG